MYKSYEMVKTASSDQPLGTGWLPQLPSMKDYTDGKDEVMKLTEPLGIGPKMAAPGLPATVDLRQDCSPIESQGGLGSCTAHAGVGVVEYFERRAFGRHINASRLFVYKTTRNLMGVVGDTGGWLRTTMGALALCGVPPEKYWPYTDRKQPGTSGERTFDDEPSSFVYAVADNYEALKYFCHDPMSANRTPQQILATVKLFLAAKIPSMFGFFGFPSFDNCDTPGGIPFPCDGERAVWGHAIVAVGYDDARKIKNTRCNRETTGALLIRNSWGVGWGDHGYGWLPYEYVLQRIALDFWSLLSMKWVETGNFGL